MKSFLFGCVLALVATKTMASTEELDVAVMRATRYAIESMPSSARHNLIEAALAYWQNFDSRVPRNSPTVSDWLKTELSSTDTNRVGRVLNTPEYAIRQLSELSTQCVTLFQFLKASENGVPLVQLYRWTKVLYCYGVIFGWSSSNAEQATGECSMLIIEKKIEPEIRATEYRRACMAAKGYSMAPHCYFDNFTVASCFTPRWIFWINTI
jgi:hypothetical protein